MARNKDHRVLNVYGEEKIRAVENAIAAAKHAERDGVDSDSEALMRIAAAYTGWEPQKIGQASD